jgi:hypothetical protein
MLRIEEETKEFLYRLSKLPTPRTVRAKAIAGKVLAMRIKIRIGLYSIPL